ncbi:hypothetical protein [Roseburia intestinalis]|uniref:hypothetical protein n=1 Tax=Roseburia intestinalis TaxID=166486 RepID=UPI001AD800A0|nr:hypothetical protein [Roseburia intestinalis]
MKKLCNYYYSLSKNNKNIGEQSIDIIRNGNEEFISIELFLIGKKSDGKCQICRRIIGILCKKYIRVRNVKRRKVEFDSKK